MITRLVLLLTLAATALPAAAEFRTVQRAYEIDLSDFRAPATTNGSLTMRTCHECSRITVRVSAATRYEINDAAVDLVEFRKRLAQVQDRDSKVITVVRHLESDTVTAVSVSL